LKTRPVQKYSPINSIPLRFFRRLNQILPNGGENSQIWREFLADFHSVASMAFGLHGGQTKDAGDITQRLKDFYNLFDLEEVRFKMALTKIYFFLLSGQP
jgi:hypothetical protein